MVAHCDVEVERVPPLQLIMQRQGGDLRNALRCGVGTAREPVESSSGLIEPNRQW